MRGLSIHLLIGALLLFGLFACKGETTSEEEESSSAKSASKEEPSVNPFNADDLKELVAKGDKSGGNGAAKKIITRVKSKDKEDSKTKRPRRRDTGKSAHNPVLNLEDLKAEKATTDKVTRESLKGLAAMADTGKNIRDDNKEEAARNEEPKKAETNVPPSIKRPEPTRATKEEADSAVPPPSKTAPPAASKSETIKGNALDLTTVINLSDLRGLIKGTSQFASGELQGVEPSEHYNALYFEPRKGTDYGLGIQVWREPTTGGLYHRYREMTKNYPNVKQNRDISRKTFAFYRGEILGVCFLDKKNKVIISITSSSATASYDQLLYLGKFLEKRTNLIK